METISPTGWMSTDPVFCAPLGDEDGKRRGRNSLEASEQTFVFQPRSKKPHAKRFRCQGRFDICQQRDIVRFEATIS